MRKYRLKIIQKILIDNYIKSQEEILLKLKEESITITQATLSRDLKYLKVLKILVPNVGYIYALPNDIKRLDSQSKSFVNIEGILSINFSQNIAVVHTLPGYATQICVNIDNAGIPEIIGTVAGDDTILVVIREDISQEQFKNVFLEHFPILKDRI
jgi:transcriptional regulator of arginine metabolism